MSYTASYSPNFSAPYPPGSNPQGFPTQQEKKKNSLRWVFPVVTVIVALIAGLIGGLIGATAVSDRESYTNVLEAPVVPSDTDNKKPAPAGSVQAVAEKVLPSVVSIQVGSGGRQTGFGSGVILSADGLIMTNAHVVNGATDIAIVTNENRVVQARLVGIDTVTDIAVVKARVKSGLRPIELGSSSNLAVGQPVVAVGAPLGLSGTVTSGIISALNRPVHVADRSGRGSDTVMNAIQIDAAINPGNSGGALVDMSGRLIGINSAIITLGGMEGPFGAESPGGNIGLGFAIPVNQAHRIAKQLAEGKTVSHSVIGVKVIPSSDPLGSEIASVVPGGAADKAGLRAGQIIVKVDGRALDPVDGLVAYVRSKAPGDVIKVTVQSKGSSNQKTVDVTVGAARN